VLHRGWGPRALNKNVLLHPEILFSRPTSMEDTTKKSNELSSSLPPSELNISEGLEGNLVEHIIIQQRGLSARFEHCGDYCKNARDCKEKSRKS
jgi:hypothetical protein